MQRQLMSELIAWKSRANRKPLLLKGARQTGKTWLLNEFASQQYQNVIRFDFMLEPSARSLFDGDLDPKRIISQIELLRGQTVTPADTLIIFDEIQEAPRGITSLKYFNELAPEYHIVAAGSYMGLALRRENESFPVGKIDQLTMRPMGFAEFVRAVDGDPLADAVLAADMNLLANVTEKLEHLLKEYLVVGGMPEVVSAFAATRDFTEARRLQQQIIEAYESDFGKHAPARIVERMRLVWKSLPGQLAKENKKFVYGALRPGARARDFEESLQWLMDYGIIHKVPRVSALRAPLSSYEDLSGFKLFCIDTGTSERSPTSHRPSSLTGPLFSLNLRARSPSNTSRRNSYCKARVPRIGPLPLAMPKPTLPSTMREPCFRLRSRRQRTLKRRV